MPIKLTPEKYKEISQKGVEAREKRSPRDKELHRLAVCRAAKRRALKTMNSSRRKRNEDKII